MAKAKTKSTAGKSRAPKSPPEKIETPSRRGCKSKYFTHVKPRLRTILAWRRHGKTFEQIEKDLGVGHTAFHEYIKLYPELAEVLNTGKEDAIAEVENAVFKRAIGYEYVETKVILEGTDDPKKLDVSPEEAAKQEATGKRRVERTFKQMAPDATSAIFFLTNRFSEKWRHKNVLEHTGADGDPLQPGTVVFYLPEKKPVETKQGANAT